MVTEAKIQKLLYNHYIKNGISTLTEFPFRRRRIDLVLLKFDEISCIEVKIKDWKKAIEQASINAVYCDRSYIAIWYRYAKNVDIQRLKKLNIGFIIINHNNKITNKFTPQSGISKNKYFVNLFNKRLKEVIQD